MVNLSFTGDLMCSPRMTERSKEDYSSSFCKANKLKHCDYLVGNLETPISGEALEYTHERYCFNTPSSFLTALKDCGFQLLTLANNHCMDRGEEGILRTLENCKSGGFETIGVYSDRESRDALFVKEINGIKIAFINYTYGTNAFAHHRFLEHPYMVNLTQPEETLPGSIHLLNRYDKIAEDVERIYLGQREEFSAVKPYLEQLRRDIERAKAAADYVIMILHSGSQYVEEVDPYSRFLAEKIKEYGADIIVGHHQHIIQACDSKDDFLKVFCLGNFMCDRYIQGEDYYFDAPQFNAVLHLSLEKRADGGIDAKKSFSIYTTAKNELGLPSAIDSYDVYKTTNATFLKEQILRYANLFAGERKYEKVQERYEL